MIIEGLFVTVGIILLAIDTFFFSFIRCVPGDTCLEDWFLNIQSIFRILEFVLFSTIVFYPLLFGGVKIWRKMKKVS